jgi:hypothetical protein
MAARGRIGAAGSRTVPIIRRRGGLKAEVIIPSGSMTSRSGVLTTCSKIGIIRSERVEMTMTGLHPGWGGTPRCDRGCGNSGPRLEEAEFLDLQEESDRFRGSLAESRKSYVARLSTLTNSLYPGECIPL